ncbi:MAG: hypothetical protein E6Q73_14595 [Pseudorhodobacter sp.]|nr:MAG: hypothetical protein E6Q73_14595 [Pseudorhodobacter sp.]
MMKTLLLSATLASVALTFASPTFAKSQGSSIEQIQEIISAEMDKRKRGKGKKVRVPGGSGCDDPGDILEHPECRG